MCHGCAWSARSAWVHGVARVGLVRIDAVCCGLTVWQIHSCFAGRGFICFVFKGQLQKRNQCNMRISCPSLAHHSDQQQQQ